MKLALVLVVCIGVAAWCARELIVGFRRGEMGALATFSTKASRAEKPGVFWFNVALNAFVATAMALAAATQLYPR